MRRTFPRPEGVSNFVKSLRFYGSRQSALSIPRKPILLTISHISYTGSLRGPPIEIPILLLLESLVLYLLALFVARSEQLMAVLLQVRSRKFR